MGSKYDKNEKSSTQDVTECVSDVPNIFWHLLWCITAQTHSNMESYLFNMIKKQNVVNGDISAPVLQ